MVNTSQSPISTRLFLLAAFLLLLVPALTALWSQLRLDRTIEELEDDGQSLDLESFLPELASGEPNASETLDAINSLLQQVPSTSNLKTLGESLQASQPDPEELQEAARLLELPHHRLAYQRLLLDAGIERARMVALGVSTPVLMDRVSYGLDQRLEILRLARLLRLRALQALHATPSENQPSQAFEPILLSLRLGSWLEQEMPVVANRLLALGVVDTALDTLEDVLLRVQPPAAERQALALALERLVGWSAGRALAGERAYIHRVSPSMQPCASNQPPCGIVDRLEAFAFTTWIEPFDSAALLKGFERLRQDAEVQPVGRLPVPRPRMSLAFRAQMLLPNISHSLVKFDEFQTKLAMAQTALAWNQWFETHGTTPTSLDELVPKFLSEPPLDPYREEPLRLAFDEDGPRLLSAGRNLEDENGQGDDLVWRLAAAR